MPVSFSQNLFDNLRSFSDKEGKQILEKIRLLIENPSHSSLNRHKLKRTKYDGLVSYYVNKDIRIISYEPTKSDIYLLRFDRHNAAYIWANSINPSLTADGVVQLIKIKESSVTETQDTKKKEVSSELAFVDLLPKRLEGKEYLFDGFSDKELLAKGYTQIYVDLVRRIATEKDLDILLENIPEAISEKLIDDIETINGKTKQDQEPENLQIRFKRVDNSSELDAWISDLNRALEEPFLKWQTFLHPNQRKVVSRNSNGPLRVTGGAGTGKTVVGIHRAKFLLDSKYFEKIYFITYNKTLKNNLQKVTAPFFEQNKIAKQVEISTFHSFLRILLTLEGLKTPNCNVDAKGFLSFAIEKFEVEQVSKFWDQPTIKFIYSEIVNVIVANNVDSVAKYMKAPRKKRGKTLTIKQKEEIWKIFEMSWRHAVKIMKMPWDFLSYYALTKITKPFKAALIVDEVQDLKASDIRFLGKIASRANQLMLLEDMKQRIYGPGYTLKALGINVVGKRSYKLYVNYRTTEEIGEAAINALGGLESKLLEKPKAVRSGPKPIIFYADVFEQELENIRDTVKASIKEGSNIAIVAKTNQMLWKIESYLKGYDIETKKLDRYFDGGLEKGVFICTMHSVKGLEFSKVIICGLGQNQGSQINENHDLQIDRNLNYVAFSRARDDLYISGRKSYLEDLVIN